MKKIIITLFCIILIILNQYKIVMAIDISEQGKQWLKIGEEKQPQNVTSGDKIQKAFLSLLGMGSNSSNNSGFGQLAGMLTAIGTLVVLVIGVVLGIRLMFTEPSKKAQAKEAIIIYLVGSIIIFGALGIWKIVIAILDGDYLY